MITGLDEKTAHRMVEINRCAECGGRLADPYGGYYGYPDQSVVICGTNAEHQGLKRITNTRKLLDPETNTWREFNVSTQLPVDEIPQPPALPMTYQGMLVRVKESIATGLMAVDSFSSNLGPAQTMVLAKVALAYGLDPLMGELAVLYGKPYPTIKAKRRKHAEAGHQPSITFRDLHRWEKTLYRQAGDLLPEDLALVCVMTRENGMYVEHFAKITREERDKKTTSDKYSSPVVRDNPIEMVQKRGESGCWEKAYGPIGIPKVFEDMLALDDPNVVEGHIISDVTLPWCDTHDVAFVRHQTEDGKRVWYSHRAQDAPKGWCNATNEQKAAFEGETPQPAPAPTAQATTSTSVGAASEEAPPTDEAPPPDDAPPPPDDAPPPPDDAPPPKDDESAGTETTITNTTVLEFAKKQGYPTRQVPAILGSKAAPVTLPAFLEAGGTLEGALAKIREHAMIDKGRVE